MGIKRIVDTSFWTDGKVDEFTPEDKYFMLYLLTNPFTTLLGIYEISIKQVAFQMGYSVDSVKALIDRFENKYDIIIFSSETNEIAIKNFLRHSIIKGGAPVRDCLIKEIKRVKDKTLISKVFSHVKDSDDLNETIKAVIAEYEEKNGSLQYCNEKKRENCNGNENDNGYGNGNGYGVSYHDTSTNRSTPKRKVFKKPSLEDIEAYCKESGYHIDVERFMNYYDSNGWMVGRNKMKDWKATVRNWASKDKGGGSHKHSGDSGEGEQYGTYL